MMRAETIYPMDLELHVKGNQVRRVWLTKDQHEVLEIVTRAMDQSISKVNGNHTINARMRIRYNTLVLYRLSNDTIVLLLTIILDDSHIDSHVDHHIDCGFSPYMLMINFVFVSFLYLT